MKVQPAGFVTAGGVASLLHYLPRLVGRVSEWSTGAKATPFSAQPTPYRIKTLPASERAIFAPTMLVCRSPRFVNTRIQICAAPFHHFYTFAFIFYVLFNLIHSQMHSKLLISSKCVVNYGEKQVLIEVKLSANGQIEHFVNKYRFKASKLHQKTLKNRFYAKSRGLGLITLHSCHHTIFFSQENHSCNGKSIDPMPTLFSFCFSNQKIQLLTRILMPVVFSPACLGLMRKLSRAISCYWKAKLIRVTFVIHPRLKSHACCSSKLNTAKLIITGKNPLGIWEIFIFSCR